METGSFGTMTLDDIIRTVYADRVLREMLSESTSNWDSFRARLELLGNRLPTFANLISIVQFGTTAAQEDDMSSEDLRQRWRRVLEVTAGSDGTVFSIGGNRFGLFMAPVSRTVLETWHEKLTQQTLLPVCIGVGRPATMPSELSRS